MSLCREKSSVLDNLRPIHRSHYLWQSIEPFNTTKLNKGKKTTEHTAAIDGEESSPGWGCVTSAPNIIEYFFAKHHLTQCYVPQPVKVLLLSSIIENSRILQESIRNQIEQTFTLILRDTFSRYCLLSFDAWLGLQH